MIWLVVQEFMSGKFVHGFWKAVSVDVRLRYKKSMCDLGRLVGDHSDSIRLFQLYGYISIVRKQIYIPLICLYSQVDPGKSLVKFHESGNQPDGSYAFRNRDSYETMLPGLQPEQAFFDVNHRALDGCNFCNDALTSIGYHHSMSVAVKEFGFELLFQPVHTASHGRLIGPKRLCSGLKTTRFCDGQKELQVSPVSNSLSLRHSRSVVERYMRKQGLSE